MPVANHTSPTTCASRCVCGADLANEVHYAKEDVEGTDKKLIELRNSGASESEIQEAQEARHVAQQRYDDAFKKFMEDINGKEMRIAYVDDEEAVLSDDDEEEEEEEEVVDPEDSEEEDEESEEELGTANMLAGGVDDEDDDDEDDEDYKPE
ncbi:hypothetical protein BDY19DRAFT_980349 [Irpex rosettiformis]|uniref:Uncharacterized protein n=1 Tax=Irpex rosettiformis TaxID=378272 RepID=A0ACB8TMI3_9APHY|nr:hypothetical protein BDY19DRAFT_980349 [Irpex rosettiformis]